MNKIRNNKHIIKASRILNYILKRKITFTIIIFVLIIAFFDNNNLIERVKNIGNLRQLQNEKRYLQLELEKTQREYHELFSDKKNLEKYARENFYLKKDNEDIFIIIEEEDK